jgi:Fe-S cluster biogenesis protein NfuA
MLTDPVTPTHPTSSLLARIEEVLNADVRAGLEADGGGVELVGVDADNIVQVRMLGACQGCSSSIYTLTMGIERALKSRIPEVRFVEAVP